MRPPARRSTDAAPAHLRPRAPPVRIGRRHNPVWRDRLFYGDLAGAFAHGTYLMYVFLLSEIAHSRPWC
ncbi:hypothetical protein EJB05_33278 [Eragrostis curvula]|uniref:Uncharacterized protein n=1 Tax=Eragrostis curvula TaxID=38414 RepID=A0A5J9U0R1_9POAL|nr:hypothetical protein EJB05_33278 [Eragrostis curvula]